MMGAEILVNAAAEAAANGNYVMTAVLVVIANYLRGIRSDAGKALRILQGEEDVEQDDGLIGQVHETERRSKQNEQRLDAADIYTEGGNQDA